MLPFYLQSFAAEILPAQDLHLEFDLLENAPADAASFRRMKYSDEAGIRKYFARLPVGPARPDSLPIECVIPAFLHALSGIGVLGLHSSAIVHQEKAFLFAGKSGSGKSTTADKFAGGGARFLADDRVLIWNGLATPSFETGNPFSRWVKHRPESGNPPAPRRIPPRGELFPIGKIYFIEIGSGPSLVSHLSPAEIKAHIAVYSGGIFPDDTFSPPAARLTVGDDLPKIGLLQ